MEAGEQGIFSNIIFGQLSRSTFRDRFGGKMIETEILMD